MTGGLPGEGRAARAAIDGARPRLAVLPDGRAPAESSRAERVRLDMSPRLLFVNRSYWPDTEATGQLLTELCEDLAATGEYDVQVLCGQPNHVADGLSADRPATEERRGVTIHRLQHTQFAKSWVPGKLANLLSFTTAAWRRTARLPRADVVITETDPFFLALLGRRLQSRWKCRYVAYLQDIYPDVAVALGVAREGLVVRGLRRLIFGAYKKADKVVVLSDDMRQRCVTRRVRKDRIEVIPNWVDVDAVQPSRSDNAFRREHRLEGKFVVMYSGNMGLPHLLQPVLAAAERVQNRPDIEFLFVGGGVQQPELAAEAERRQLRNVRFLPYQPKERLGESLSAADVQIVSVKPGVISCLMPSKLYGVLAAGAAVLAIAPHDCELSRIVLDEQLGEVCSNGPEAADGRELAEAIVRLMNPDRLQEIGRRGRAMAEAEFSRGRAAERFRRLLQGLLAPEGTARDAARGAAVPAESMVTTSTASGAAADAAAKMEAGDAVAQSSGELHARAG